MSSRIYRLAGGILATIAVIYLAAAGYLFVFQRDYVFEPRGILTSPGEKGLGEAEVVTIRAGDGVDLIGWYQAAEPGLPTVLYFHGNSGNISDRSPRFQQIAASGFGFLAMSYRGYAGSGGDPSEAALVADGLTIFDWLAERSEDIVIHGESLGTAVAVQVAAKRSARALVLEAPFIAALDIAAATYPWLPTSLLMRDPFLSREHIGEVSEPLLVVHGTADTIIPIAYGKRLFAVANEPKSMIVMDGAGHLDLWKRGLWPAVLDFLRRHGLVAQAPPVVRRTPSRAG